LEDKTPVSLLFEESNPDLEFVLNFNTGRFCFTDCLLDFTFVELDPKELNFPKGVKFLKTNIANFANKKVFIIQHMLGDPLVDVSGYITRSCGINYAHRVNTDVGSSGSAICSPEGDVVGIHKMADLHQRCNFGTRIQCIQFALSIAVASPELREWRTGIRITLEPSELNELQRHGLVQTANEEIFESPEFRGVPASWFLRTNHAWYWSPSELTDVNDIYAIKSCNWTVIHAIDDIKSIGRSTHSNLPGPTNLAIIEWLITTAFSLLHDIPRQVPHAFTQLVRHVNPIEPVPRVETGEVKMIIFACRRLKRF
jgi:hypothetical protein